MVKKLEVTLVNRIITSDMPAGCMTPIYMKNNLGAEAAREQRSLMAWTVLTREKWWRCVAQCLARAHSTSL